MANLVVKLQEYMEGETLFGFCPWGDDGGEIWGRILEMREEDFTFQEVDPFGQDAETSVHDFSLVVYIDDNPTYARRLGLLKGYRTTLPVEVTPTTDPIEIRESLTTATVSEEVVRISFPGSSLVDVTVNRIADDWVEVVNYDNLMRPTSTQIVRIDSITEVVWRDATCQCETHLRGLARDLSVAAGPKDESRNLN